jgi:hypothetical protein
MKLWGYIDGMQHGAIVKTRVDSAELSWPWVEIPKEINTHGIKAWRKDGRDGEWLRRYQVRISISVNRILIDSEEYADVMLIVDDQDEFQIVKQWTDLRLWVEDVLYLVKPGEIIRVRAHSPRRIVVRLDDARVYSFNQEESITALEPVPDREDTNGGT